MGTHAHVSAPRDIPIHVYTHLEDNVYRGGYVLGLGNEAHRERILANA